MIGPSAEPLVSNRNDLRTWVDATGQYEVTAQFVAILENDTVRLLRADGRYVRVAFDKLSSNDQRYLRQRFPTLAMSW
jgi:hypothetical protein